MKTQATDLNIELGKKLKFARTTKSLSQRDIANKLGITYQQYQKYEKGENKLSVNLLIDFKNLFEFEFDYYLNFNN